MDKDYIRNLLRVALLAGAAFWGGKVYGENGEQDLTYKRFATMTDTCKGEFRATFGTPKFGFGAVQ